MAARTSGVQKEILKIYRAFLREVRRREPNEREGLLTTIKSRFKKDKQIPR
jgi:hypothetical protein